MGTRLAVIAMACNEQEVLPRLLGSLAGYEVHVSIDQKTTDESRKVARKHKAKLYQHEFVNNSWADTRNAVMAEVEAASEADWFLWLDADEWLLQGAEYLPEALALAEANGAEGVGVTLQDHKPAGSLVTPGRWLNVKILKRGVRFERRRHEVVPAGLVRVQAPQIVVGHQKAQRPEVIAANEKLKHDLSALLADFGDFGDRRSAFYVADAYQAAGELHTAIAWYERGLGLPDTQQGMEGMLRDGLAQTWRLLGKPERAREAVRPKLLLGREEFGEACFDIGGDSLNAGDYDNAEFYLSMALAAGGQRTQKSAGIGNPEKMGTLAYYALALVEGHRGNLLTAAAWLGKASESGPNPKFDALWKQIVEAGAKSFEKVSEDAVVCQSGSGSADAEAGGLAGEGAAG